MVMDYKMIHMMKNYLLFITLPPGDHCTITLKSCKSSLCGRNFYSAPEFKPEAEELSPPHALCPQVTTVPSLLSAAKAQSLEKISVTPELKLEATEELSPP